MQWLALARREGRELARRHDWQRLVVPYTFTTVALEAQAALPADYDHFVPDVEIWNRSSNTRYCGPVFSNEWMQLRSGFSSGAHGWWRLIGNVLHLYPAPTAGQTIALEYVSKNWCASGAGVTQSTWLANADVGLISEELMSLGITWRWLQAKGMDYAEHMATYERELERMASRDRGLRVMTIGKTVESEWPYGDVSVNTGGGGGGNGGGNGSATDVIEMVDADGGFLLDNDASYLIDE